MKKNKSQSVFEPNTMPFLFFLVVFAVATLILKYYYLAAAEGVAILALIIYSFINRSRKRKALKAYIEAKKELDADFRSQDFMLDKILCIVASVKGKSYYWINDGINTPIEKGSDVNVNREQLLNIMKEKVGETFQDVENHNIRE